ncbi:MAG: hypothetical protein F6K40_05455 [Okeania sp. SIO3I5]|uniref:hypothetical protein n=1 Tax=Okeania sp. SIO3I5 TaxID=2607805 RepID=UPI0013BE3AD9|nr:hypothetical protein [Okeania sp. SIO3I5]NEQ35762.1 hypothetical protein [Okeania sp. SIO3I5]
MNCHAPDFTALFFLDEPHRHNQNPVGTFHGTSLLWSTGIKTAVNLGKYLIVEVWLKYSIRGTDN